MTRGSLALAGLAALVGVAVVAWLAVDRTPASGPNVVLIVVDDLGATDLGVTGSDLHLTPAMDRLADEGIRFTQAYSASPVCSPARVALVTGQHPARVHLTDWLPGRKREEGTPRPPEWIRELPRLRTVGDVLGEQGYATAWFGKWHLGSTPVVDYGFDAGGEEWKWMRDRKTDDPKGTRRVTDLAIDFMEAQQGRPFFVAVSHYAVHQPMIADVMLTRRADRRLRQRGPGRHHKPEYAAMVERVDEEVGRLVDWLDAAGLSENTLVVLTSDNGGVLRHTSNAPLRAGKGTVYEGGIRVPLIVRQPGRIDPAVRTDVVSGLDLLPTFAALAGSTFEGDGRSLLPALAGEPLAEAPFFTHYPHHNRAAVDSFPGGSVRRGRYKLVERFSPGASTFELYDVEADPGESQDLSVELPDVQAELAAALGAWRQQVGAQEMR